MVPVLEADHGFSRPHLPLVQLYIKESKNAILFDAIDDGMIRNARCLSRHRGHYSFLQIVCTWFFVNGNKLLKLSYRIRRIILKIITVTDLRQSGLENLLFMKISNPLGHIKLRKRPEFMKLEFDPGVRVYFAVMR